MAIILKTRKRKATPTIKREAVVLTPELKLQVEQRVREMLDIAEKRWNRKFEMPQIRYDIHTRMCGLAYPHSNLLRFNPIYLVENVTDYIRETVGHEVIHLINHVINAGKGKLLPHGEEWKAIMLFYKIGPKGDSDWNSVIKGHYNTSSIEIKPRRKHGPRKAGGRKVGEILLKMKTLTEDELKALIERCGFEIKFGMADEPRPLTAVELQVLKDGENLREMLHDDYGHVRTRDMKSTASWAIAAIKSLEGVAE